MRTPDRIAAAWFSPTGTTRAVVTLLAGELGRLFNVPVERTDFTLPAGRVDPPRFRPGDLAVVGVQNTTPSPHFRSAGDLQKASEGTEGLAQNRPAGQRPE